MSEAERKELNLNAAGFISSLGLLVKDPENEFDELQKAGFAGFADYYLQTFYCESDLENKAEIEIYKDLLEIDSQLGTPQTEQLIRCAFHSVRIDLIKVLESMYCYLLKFKLL